MISQGACDHLLEPYEASHGGVTVSACIRAERTLRDNLAHNGVGECKRQRSIRLTEKSVAPDIAVSNLRTIVEYDGPYWHHGGTRHRKDIEEMCSAH